MLQRPSEISTIIKDGRIVDREAGGFRQLPDELPRARASTTIGAKRQNMISTNNIPQV